MKSLTQILFKAVLLLNVTILLEQESIRAQKIEEGAMNGGEYNCLDNQLSAINLLPSNSKLSVTPKLMMNPLSIEEGTKAVGETLGVFGKGAITAERTVKAGNGDLANAISSISSSNQVLRLRGGGPKKSQPTGGLKSTGDSSDEEDTGISPDLESEETSPMDNQVNKYLKEEIINNIYTECLAEVTKLTLGGSVTAGNVSKETAEWAVAKEAAEYSKRKAERAVTIAAKKTEEAKGMINEAKKGAKAASRVPLQGSAVEQALITATVNYEKARETYAIADYEAKKLEEKLSEARVETADANLYAISVRNTGQKAIAETGLDTSKETEMQALEAVDAAKADVAVKVDLLSNAEAILNDAKKSVKGMTPTSPMTAAQKVAMKEIEEDKGLAEAAKSIAKKAELKANVAKGKVHEMNFERELKAYHDAEEAWIEAGEGYKTALAKVNKMGLDDEELEVALANAEVHQATWRAHTRWVKARQTDQMVAAPGASPDKLRVAKEAWAGVAKGYQMALEKARIANLQCEELTVSCNNAISAQESIIAIEEEQKRKEREKAQAELTKKIQVAQSKVQTATGNSLSCWREVIASLEKSAEYWKKASEAQTGLGTDYSLAATESEQAAEYSSKAAEAYEKAMGEDENWREGNGWKEAGKSVQCSVNCRIKGIEEQRLGKQANAQEWASVAEKLKQATTSFIQAAQLLLEGKEKEQDILWSEGASLQSEGMSKKYQLQGLEAQEAGKITLAAGCREAAATFQQAIAAGKRHEDCRWVTEVIYLQSKADYQVKAAEAEESGKTALVAGYREAIATFQRSADQYQQAGQAIAAGKKDKGYHWSGEDSSLREKSRYQEKAAEAEESGKTALAAGYREAAATFQRVADRHQQAAQAIAEGKEDEGYHWSSEIYSLQSKADYQVKAAEAQESGKTALAADYHEAAAISQRAANQEKELALAKAAGCESDYIRLEKAREATRTEENAIEKRVQS